MDSKIIDAREVYHNLSREELIEHVIRNGEGVFSDTGALICNTGKFTGRSPKDRYIVKDDRTADKVWWGDINIPFSSADFERIYDKMRAHIRGQRVYVKEVYAGADPRFCIKVRVINTLAWHNLFCDNMFITDSTHDTESSLPDFTIINCPEFEVDPLEVHTRQKNFALIDFSRKMILIGGTGYSGEIKKGIFSVLNFLLATDHAVLPMHCSANIGETDKDVAIFFGLSGTGKTTLSSAQNRLLIGDDEHAWTDEGVFNYEGGCYAKTIDLNAEKEPDIYRAIRFGAILENTLTFADSREVNYSDTTITKNTRVSYPLTHISTTVSPSLGGIPKHIFFLTCDAYGIIPPIQKLSPEQAMFHFISGYTSKIAGTEEGIDEPVPVFSACFGEPFMPLHPSIYAKMLDKKIQQHGTQVWLINTGWANGPYGVGSRTELRYTRAMIDAALSGQLEEDQVDYREHTVFKTKIPAACPGVPTEILSPKEAWGNDTLFYEKAYALAEKFHDNLKRLHITDPHIIAGGPHRK